MVKSNSTLISIVSESEQSAEPLVQPLLKVGYRVGLYSDLTGLKQALEDNEEDIPHAIVFIFDSQAHYDATLAELAVFTTFEFYIPMVICGVEDTMQVRLKSFRAGATRYLARPVKQEQIVGILDELTLRQPPEPYKVLIIDDESISLDMYSGMLQQAGMQVFSLQDPEKIFNVIDRVKPEVVVLDVYMPKLNGFELAAILREKEEFRDIPIMFLSAESDISAELHALSLGGDDYYVKPLEAKRFVNIVSVRAKRWRQINRSREQLKQALYERDREHLALNRHALVSVTDAAGKIILANDKFSEVSGYSTRELMGKSHRILKSGKHSPEYYDAMWRTISGGNSWHGEICNRRKDGSFYWVESTITPLIGEDDKPYQYISIRTDITEQKVAEAQLRRARDQAEKANKAKSEFLANMSHELRTPLNAIVGFSQLLETSDDISDVNRDDAREILKASKHLLGLINDVLDLSKIEAGKLEVSLEPVNLMAVLRECITMIMPMALSYEIMMDCEDHDQIIVHCDRGRLRQVLLNLMSNAVKYNVKNGAINIHFDFLPEQQLRVNVTDTGLGISEQDQALIFKPFSRLDCKYSEIEGTGIGLALTRELVEQMGGQVGVISEEKKGSTFWFELPLLEADAEENSETFAMQSCKKLMQASHPEPKQKQVKYSRVVYIDDNRTNLKLVESILGRQPNIDLLAIDDSEQGLQEVLRHKPALLLLDIHMPGLNGYDILKTLRENRETKSLPIVAISANALVDDVQEGIERGFDAYLTKPINVDRFISLVEKYTGTTQQQPEVH